MSFKVSDFPFLPVLCPGCPYPSCSMCFLVSSPCNFSFRRSFLTCFLSFRFLRSFCVFSGSNLQYQNHRNNAHRLAAHGTELLFLKNLSVLLHKKKRNLIFKVHWCTLLK